MKKNNLRLILLLSLAFCLLLTLMACKNPDIGNDSESNEPEISTEESQPETESESTIHEHSFTEQVKDDAYSAAQANCTAAAQYFYSCACGEKGTEVFEDGSPIGHTPGAEATCTAAQTCTVCDAEITAALGHDYGTAVTDPTCTEDGYTTYTCSRCKDSYTDDETNASGHTPGAEATCTTAQTCTVCDAEITAALGHDYGAAVTDPTCTEGGYTTYTCSRCGYYYKSNKTAAKGHTSGAKATCTTPRTCTVCSIVLSPALGHVPGAEATCTTPQICTVCDAEITAALGHTPGQEAKCTLAQYCIVCYVELAPAKGHDYRSVETEPTYTQSGYTTHTCNACGDYYIDTYTIPADITITLANRDMVGFTGVAEEVLVIPDVFKAEDGTWYKVIAIGSYAFRDCTNLTEVKIPVGVKSIGTYAFDGCTSLKNLIIPTDSVLSSIGSYAFSDCTSLTSIDIPTTVLTLSQYAFYNCTSLKSITFAEYSLLNSIGTYAFGNCKSLTGIEIPSGVTVIESRTFTDCASLISVKMPATVTTIGDYAFSGCASLKEVQLPAGVTTIGTYAFQNCVGLTSINIPGSITSIANYVFQNCTSLTKVTIQDGVNKIGTKTFYGCTSLKEVQLPTTLTSIGNNAFQNCLSLTRIEIPGTVTSIGKSAFSGCTSLATINFNGKTSVWSAKVKKGSGWSDIVPAAAIICIDGIITL